MTARHAVFTAICLLIVTAGSFLAMSRTYHEVDLESAVEIWADVLRDADQLGLTLTRVPVRKEMEIGREIEREFHRHWLMKKDAELENYIAHVAQPLLEHVQRKTIAYRFYVVESSLVNAYALPGGGIYITTGMLKVLNSEAELAAILGHEISHVDLRHCIERLQYELASRKVFGKNSAMIARIGYGLIQLSFSEQQELEADAAGMILAAQAGYDPRAAITIFERLHHAKIPDQSKKPTLMVGELGSALSKAFEQYFATHPATDKRIQELHLVLRRHENEWKRKQFYVGEAMYKYRVAESVRRTIE